MDSASSQQMLGNHEAQLVNLHNDITSIKKSLDSLIENQQAIIRTLSEAKGGWKTLLLVAGASGAVATLISHIPGLGFLIAK